jgi:hypothetical protein
MECEGLPIDIVKIEDMPVYYKQIRNAVEKAASGYWNSLKVAKEVITGIPTLDYYQKSQMPKVLMLAIILLTSFHSFAQAHIDFGGGIASVTSAQKVESSNAAVMKISGGYQFGNIVTEAVIQPSLSRGVNTPCYLGAKIGYNIQGLIPSIGYLYNYRNADDVSMNRWEVGYALKYQFEVGENGGIYIEGMYTKSAIELTAGFHIKF